MQYLLLLVSSLPLHFSIFIKSKLDFTVFTWNILASLGTCL